MSLEWETAKKPFRKAFCNSIFVNASDASHIGKLRKDFRIMLHLNISFYATWISLCLAAFSMLQLLLVAHTSQKLQQSESLWWEMAKKWHKSHIIHLQGLDFGKLRFL